MKMKIIIGTALLSVSCVVSAQTTTSQSQTQSQATSAAQNAGNAQAITFNNDSPGKQRIYSTPAVGGQGFYGSFSPDSCTVSAGGGGAFKLFGINFAGPVDIKSCIALRGFERTMQASVAFQNLGDAMTAARLRQSAIDMLCQVSDEVHQALQYQGLCSDFKKTYQLEPPPPVLIAAKSVQRTIHMRINQDGTVTQETK